MGVCRSKLCLAMRVNSGKTNSTDAIPAFGCLALRCRHGGMLQQALMKRSVLLVRLHQSSLTRGQLACLACLSDRQQTHVSHDKPRFCPSGAAAAALGPLVFPGQAALHPALLQFLFGPLGQAQQPQGQSQGAPPGQQLPQPVPLSHPFMLPYHQAFMQVSHVYPLTDRVCVISLRSGKGPRCVKIVQS